MTYWEIERLNEVILHICYRIVLNIYVFLCLFFLKHKIKKIESSVKTGGREK